MPTRAHPPRSSRALRACGGRDRGRSQMQDHLTRGGRRGAQDGGRGSAQRLPPRPRPPGPQGGGAWQCGPTVAWAANCPALVNSFSSKCEFRAAPAGRGPSLVHFLAGLRLRTSFSFAPLFRARRGHKKSVPAAPKPGDRALMTPAQKVREAPRHCGKSAPPVPPPLAPADAPQCVPAEGRGQEGDGGEGSREGRCWQQVTSSVSGKALKNDVDSNAEISPPPPRAPRVRRRNPPPSQPREAAHRHPMRLDLGGARSHDARLRPAPRRRVGGRGRG